MNDKQKIAYLEAQVAQHHADLGVLDNRVLQLAEILVGVNATLSDHYSKIYEQYKTIGFLSYELTAFTADQDKKPWFFKLFR